MTPDPVENAAKAIANADAMIIGTGAGMGVDSGLGTFRGRNAGVWEPLKAMQRDFTEMSCPDVFDEDAGAAWAFWKFRHDSYTQSAPHDGYHILSEWGQSMTHGCWSITSNIDGHWARTPGVGTERTYEMHGSLTYMQTIDGRGQIWPTDAQRDYAPMRVAPWDLNPGEPVEIRQGNQWQAAAGGGKQAQVAEDGATILAYDGDGVGGPIAAEGVRRPGGGVDLCRIEPGCPFPHEPDGSGGGALARPNVLMFGDASFNGDRIDEQAARYKQWLDALAPTSSLVIVEVGAGTAVPTIRMACQRLLERWVSTKRDATLVRVNLDQSDVGVGLGKRAIAVGGMGALEALRKLDERVRANRA